MGLHSVFELISPFMIFGDDVCDLSQWFDLSECVNMEHVHVSNLEQVSEECDTCAGCRDGFDDAILLFAFLLISNSNKQHTIVRAIDSALFCIFPKQAKKEKIYIA